MEFDRIFAGEVSATLEQVLAAREARAAMQKKLLAEYGLPLISFTLNLPGSYKAYPLAFKAFTEGCALIASALTERGWVTLFRDTVSGTAGFEGFCAVRADARDVKAVMMSIEDSHPLGRLFDIDVLMPDGVPLKGEAHGREERRCLVCEKPVWACARSRTHSAEELAFRAYSLLRDFFLNRYSDRIASDAQTALLYEVAVTPKPGLVDRANNGAHTDMDMFTFLRSGSVLGSYFRDCVKNGANHTGSLETLLPSARSLGISAERSMLRATGGINTHKGAIFSLGIICLALGRLWEQNRAVTPDACLDACAVIAAVCLSELEADVDNPDTHGLNCYRNYGLHGIRGEAANGFPHVRLYGLPVLTKSLEAGSSLNDAGMTVFLHLLARVQDTCAIHRSDRKRFSEIQERLQGFLAENPDTEAQRKYAGDLDKRLIRDNISPGGCADLLAASYFLYLATHEKTAAGL